MKTLIPTPTLGTIIHATLRNQDLIPAFLDAISEYAPAEYEQIMATPFSMPPAYAMEDEDSEWWDSEEAYEFCYDLMDILSTYSPPYAYFGAHPGDGSDFGFWPLEEALEELPKISCTSQVEDMNEDCLYVNDHGNITVYAADGSIIWDCV